MQAQYRKLLWIVFLLTLGFLPGILAPAALGQELQYNIYDFRIRYGSVLVVHELVFTEPVNLSYEMPMPPDAKGILLTVNNENQQPRLSTDDEALDISIQQKHVQQIRVSYITENMLDGLSFVASLTTPFPTETIQARLTLEPGITLAEPLTKDSGSIYPKPDKVDQDEQSQIYIWEKQGLPEGEALSLYVIFRKRIALFWIAIPIILFVLILGFYLYYIKQTKRIQKKKM